MNFWEFLWVLLIWTPLFLLWGTAIFDTFRRDDIGGGKKVLWVVVIILLPFLGTLIYLLMRPAGATAAERTALDTASRQFVAEYTPTDTAQQLALLVDLRDRGALSAQESEIEKARVLGQDTTPGAPAMN